MKPAYLKFRYVNWRNDDHEYVIEVEGMTAQRADGDIKLPHLSLLTFAHVAPHPATGVGVQPVWALSGNVITRDGLTRPEIASRSRTFALIGMRDIEEIAE